jgi:antitoxin (DNA-binding transcriptional repressor) of toxin-antitoxin stability system
MDISVTRFKHSCLKLIREVERTGQPVTIRRRGRVVARLDAPAASQRAQGLRPWERLRGTATCKFKANESVLRASDFEANR